jgi:Tannase and feruloyl esterase
MTQRHHVLTASAVAALLAGCAQLEGTAVHPGQCDASLAVALRPDTNATLVSTRLFKAGEAVALAQSPTQPAPTTAPVDVCLVKLMVGPGYPGPEDAPYASKGIGIEVWLPTREKWNGILRVIGSGGWAGGAHGDATRIGRTGAAEPVQMAAVAKGYVVSSSDHGHRGRLALGTARDASFTLREDGSTNTALWRDFSERSMHELAEKTKALSQAYYGRRHQYAYWDGFSTGGRQGYKLAQRYPKDFDGILAGAPAFNWTRFITAELYPQIVMQRELGGPIALPKLNAASSAANAACGGATLGFQLDPLACRYDPAKDAAALCAGAPGKAGVIGTNSSPERCLSFPEAEIINKIWYGITANGLHPDPQADNAAGPMPANADHLWFGLSRGTTLGALAGTPPFAIASVQVALQLQDPRYAQADQPYITNPKGGGADKWKELDVRALARAYQRGLEMQGDFADINTDDADLNGARSSGLKILSYHGLADELIMPQGSLNYFQRASERMGSVEALQSFNRLMFIPGHAHDSTFARSGAIDPATGAITNADKVPMPQAATGRDELFMALRNWVEKGVAPERVEVSSRNGSVSMPLCSHPRKARHDGVGSVTAAASYACR